MSIEGWKAGCWSVADLVQRMIWDGVGCQWALSDLKQKQNQKKNIKKQHRVSALLRVLFDMILYIYIYKWNRAVDEFLLDLDMYIMIDFDSI